MKYQIVIDVDNQSPDIELCGGNCKCLSNGRCQLFDEILEDYSDNVIEDEKDGVIIYDKTKNIYAWKRCKKCIDKFYSLGEVLDNDVK